MNRLICFAAAWFALILGSPGGLAAELPSFHFNAQSGLLGWEPTHDVAPLGSSAEGLLISITGSDPYIHGPARDYPAATELWAIIRLKSDVGGTAQLFYFVNSASEQDSVRFSVPKGVWHDVRVPIPALGARHRLRLDPPGTSGRCVVAWIRFEERVLPQPPRWPTPIAATIESPASRVVSGDLTLEHGGEGLGQFFVQVAGERMAVGHSEELIGYQKEGRTRWVALANADQRQVSLTEIPRGFEVRQTFRDPDQGRWEIARSFREGQITGTVEVEVRIRLDQNREVFYLPLLSLLPGLGTYGTNKTQAVFAGLEYLENELSSSEADVIGTASQRQVPDVLKSTFPLAAIAAEERYVGLIWEMQSEVAALFDSPDRFFNSGGHLMGLLFPGSNGTNRPENSLLPYGGEQLRGGELFIVRAFIIGGLGKTVVPAIQKYVQVRGLPPVPDPGVSRSDYLQRTSESWLDSKIREGNLFRHALWPGFGLQPAADAAFWMDWLSVHLPGTAIAVRLHNAALGALSQVQKADFNSSGVGHIRYPATALAFRAAGENAARAEAQGKTLLSRFQADGSVQYQKPLNGVDYGRTHYAPDASGLTGQVLAALLEAAVFSGDAELIDAAIEKLRLASEKYGNGVPRGAQTWEVPLHTPDILASAHLVRAYTLGFQITGDAGFLEQARYWAWTGVPFIYLVQPVPQPIGVYSTIPVYGATGWIAPVWIGLPVQWCGMVYADALYRLSELDSTGPWQQLADGITAAGIQHSWPSSDLDRRGLLPDIFELRGQHRDGPAINPATVQAGAVRFYDFAPVYDFEAVNSHGLFVHAPGGIEGVSAGAEEVKFTVVGWPDWPYQVVVSGLRGRPGLKLNGKATEVLDPHHYSAREGRLILQLEGRVDIELEYGALNALRIRRAPGAGAVEVLWPPTATNYVLESSAIGAALSEWEPVGVEPSPAQEGFTVTDKLQTPGRLYRLVRPTR